MIKREEYLNKLLSLKDKQIIKVITGIRRCGKSTLFDLYEEYLLNNGVTPEQIIHINFEESDDEKYKDIKTHSDLYNYVKDRLIKDKMTYVILDEIQFIPDFQKAVDALFVKKNVVLYITCSNSFILSCEFAFQQVYGNKSLSVLIKRISASFSDIKQI